VERQFPAGIMPDFWEMLSPRLRENYGQWVWHEFPAPGVIRHLTAAGEACISVRVQLPPNGYLSAATLRVLARWIRTYAEAGRRTSRQAFELVGVAPDRLADLLDEVRQHGFLVGGTGSALHQIKGCTGFVHCQNAAIDSPGIMKALGDALADEIDACCYPAPLKLSVSGCPNHCGAGVEADIGIVGIFRDPPQLDLQRMAEAPPDFGLLGRWCPGGAIKVKCGPEGRLLTILEDRCIRCTSCVMVAPDSISMGPRRGAAIVVGGRGLTGGRGANLACMAVPYLPAEPPHYPAIIQAVKRLIAAWVTGAKPGERVADYIDRVGLDEFLHQAGARTGS
jgi:sulfite reductase beta subunit